MNAEVTLVLYFPEGEEPPNRYEIESVLQRRYPDVVVLEFQAEEV